MAEVPCQNSQMESANEAAPGPYFHDESEEDEGAEDQNSQMESARGYLAPVWVNKCVSVGCPLCSQCLHFPM